MDSPNPQRSVMCLRDGEWYAVASLLEVKAGDVFKMFEVDGSVVPGTPSTARSDGYTDCMGIKCIEAEVV